MSDLDPVDWLMTGDPAIRWQTMRDLMHAPRREWEAERTKVGLEGWGRQLLDFQDETGRWTPKLYGYKWISTTYSMVLLRRMGLPPRHPAALRACALFLDEGLWSDGGINLSTAQRRSETCITGMVLALLCWFDHEDERRERLVGYLVEQQLDDGGWNCERHRGASHSSLHTTITVLEALREYAFASGRSAEATEAAEAEGRLFLLDHRLFRSHRTGEVIDPRMTRLSFPPRWRHDVLRGLDYFRSADGERDNRLDDGIDAVMSKRRADGTWPLQQRYAGRTWFEMERVGHPSRWNTLRALRVLDWWNRVEK